MEFFLSCDWGTSSFRLRLVRLHNLTIVGEIVNEQGIAATHLSWSEMPALADRVYWYSAVLLKAIEELRSNLGMASLAGTPVVISGMASSSIGMLELPYAALPVQLDATGLITKWWRGNEHDFLLISGLRSEEDTMRGEETKLVGIIDRLPVVNTEQFLLLPGTHPKHVRIRNRALVGFRTYMTGEVFSLLAGFSILSESIEKTGSIAEPLVRNGFLKAVRRSRELPLLHHSFLVRTNQILLHMPKEQNYYYLSGVLIGEELKSVNADAVFLLGGGMHTSLYKLACEEMGIELAGVWDADEALIRGQRTILSRQPAPGN